MNYRDILVETLGRVGVIRLNRPQRMNALNDALAAELAVALAAFDADPAIGAIIITGNDKAFAAGADIGAMAEWGYQKVYADNYIMSWESVKHTRKPVIAAVAGYALGGGCELAMMCDLIIAADNAKFGQPEITIGTMPGMGGTQRLPRAVGKAKAMDWCLTGRMIDAGEAERSGLVARVGDFRARRSEGRHARVRRQTQAGVQAPVAKVLPSSRSPRRRPGPKFAATATYQLGSRASGCASRCRRCRRRGNHRRSSQDTGSPLAWG